DQRLRVCQRSSILFLWSFWFLWFDDRNVRDRPDKPDRPASSRPHSFPIRPAVYASCTRTNMRASIRSFLVQRCFSSNRCSSAAIRAVISGSTISTCSRRSCSRRLSLQSPRYAADFFFARPTARPCARLRGTILLIDMVPSRLRVLLYQALQGRLSTMPPLHPTS